MVSSGTWEMTCFRTKLHLKTFSLFLDNNEFDNIFTGWRRESREWRVSLYSLITANLTIFSQAGDANPEHGGRHSTLLLDNSELDHIFTGLRRESRAWRGSSRTSCARSTPFSSSSRTWSVPRPSARQTPARSWMSSQWTVLEVSVTQGSEA